MIETTDLIMEVTDGIDSTVVMIDTMITIGSTFTAKIAVISPTRTTQDRTDSKDRDRDRGLQGTCHHNNRMHLTVTTSSSSSIMGIIKLHRDTHNNHRITMAMHVTPSQLSPPCPVAVAMAMGSPLLVWTQ